MEYEEYLDTILGDNKYVSGEIYLITNTKTNKQYVGQTLSHHLNHGKYRPYGYKCRFNTHMSAAKSIGEKNTYLINAIRKYGPENFTVSLLKRCNVEELDEYEQHYIKTLKTLYPTGYNLSTGGRYTTYVPVCIKDNDFDFEIVKKPRDYQTDETKKKISKALKEYRNTEEGKEQLKLNTLDQHMKKREDLFKDIHLSDSDDIEKFIRRKKNNNKVRYVIKIKGVETSFYGPIEEDDVIKERAYNFLRSLKSTNNI
jgi:group I intron endonuclease